jgi:hypothetical protein
MNVVDEQIRLDAIARVVLPLEYGLTTMREPVAGIRGEWIYTLELRASRRGWPDRWLAVHSSVVRQLDDRRLGLEIADAFRRTHESAHTPSASA